MGRTSASIPEGTFFRSNLYYQTQWRSGAEVRLGPPPGTAPRHICKMKGYTRSEWSEIGPDSPDSISCIIIYMEVGYGLSEIDQRLHRNKKADGWGPARCRKVFASETGLTDG